MRVSIIIPVYKAAKFVRQAVESALAQPETGEVILIEDDSPDNSLQVCQELARRYDKVKLFRHPDGKNHGAGASRNVGIKKAQFDYIAFLDADDYFLPGRFLIARQLFEEEHSIDGVYEAVGVHFENEDAKKQWRELGAKMLTTMTEYMPPERLFEAQAPIGDSGYTHINGWVVKRCVFKKTGLFDENLRLHQDTAMLIKFAAFGRMMPGRLDCPVAIRRRHSQNRAGISRSPRETYRDRVLMWGTLWKWGRVNLCLPRQKIILKRFVNYAASPYQNHSSHVLSRAQSIRQLLVLLLEYPYLLGKRLFWRKLLKNLMLFVAMSFVGVKRFIVERFGSSGSETLP